MFEQEEFEDPTWIIRSRKSKQDRQHSNGKEKKEKMTNNDLQNTAQKTKDRATRTTLISGVNADTLLR